MLILLHDPLLAKGGYLMASRCLHPFPYPLPEPPFCLHRHMVSILACLPGASFPSIPMGAFTQAISPLKSHSFIILARAIDDLVFLTGSFGCRYGCLRICHNEHPALFPHPNQSLIHSPNFSIPNGCSPEVSWVAYHQRK